MTSIQPPGRSAHVFAYTAVDLEETYTPPLLPEGVTPTVYRYNLDRQLTAIERPDGPVVSLLYDSGGRLSQVSAPHGATGYGYEVTTGNLASISAPGGINLAYTWDGFLPLSEAMTGEVTGSVARSYNADLQVTSLAVDGQAVAYGYDADGLLTQAGALGLSRDAQNGLLTGTTLGNLTTALTYNAFGELASETATRAGTALYQASYTRDGIGRITEKHETAGGTPTTWGYSYDDAGRLVGVLRNGAPYSSYVYDANGNRLSRSGPGGTVSGTYDAQDRLLTYGAAAYTYTANGELTSKTEGGATTRYGYDVYGNLRRVELPGDVAIDYVIDGRNRRVGKKVNGVLTQGFVYQDQLNPVAELDGAGNLVSRFVYGSRGHVPDYMVKGGKTYRYVTDQLGSPRLLVDTDTGAVAQQIEYDEFGKVLSDSNPGFQPFYFAGGLYDLHTGLVRFGARDYDPVTGRWTAKDPIGFSGLDANMYSYTYADPVGNIDPLGLWAWGDPLPQGLADALTGFGDGAFAGATLGIGDLQGIRELFGVDGGINKGSALYCGFRTVGTVVGVFATGGAFAQKAFQRGGWLNSNQFLRIGFGRKGGNVTFRAAGRWVERTFGKPHIDFWTGGPL